MKYALALALIAYAYHARKVSTLRRALRTAQQEADDLRPAALRWNQEEVVRRIVRDARRPIARQFGGLEDVRR